MTNFTNDVRDILKDFEFQIEEIDERELNLTLKNEDVIHALSVLKNSGFSHLSILTCIDWIDENEFELVYILFSWETGRKLLVSTRIDREKAEFFTAMNLWPVARFYEREIHEFFGVRFIGNDDMKPLILELWDDKPPLRKDFDPQEYAKKRFPGRTYQKDVLKEAKIIRGGENGRS